MGKLLDQIRKQAAQEMQKPMIDVSQSNPPDLGDTVVDTLRKARGGGSKSKITGPRPTDKSKQDNESNYRPTVHGVRQMG